MNPQQFPHPSRSRIHPAINEDVRPAPSSNIHKLTDVSDKIFFQEKYT
jgi:hypothetical protein